MTLAVVWYVDMRRVRIERTGTDMWTMLTTQGRAKQLWLRIVSNPNRPVTQDSNKPAKEEIVYYSVSLARMTLAWIEQAPWCITEFNLGSAAAYRRL